jgi:hypothetical protein
MEEQLVSFDIAKLAKEKGFNLKTFHYYISHDTTLPRSEAFFDWNTTYMNCGGRISCPTQSLLQKWLREKCKIIISINPIYTNKAIGSCELSGFIFTINGKNTFDEYKTYEEALEVGLYKVLKFI